MIPPPRVGTAALEDAIMADQRLPNTSNEFLTVAEVAKTLRLNQQTILVTGSITARFQLSGSAGG